jgi:hypothetical protein
MNRIYIAGPMTGFPELNFPAFHAATAEWRAKGWHVENPAEINADPKKGWNECMRADIPRLVTCDAIYLLPGWKLSRGARIEAHIARELGMAVHEQPGVELTGKQATALHLIRQHQAEHGHSPSFKAIAVDMGVAEQNARAFVLSLQRKGLIVPHKQRAPRASVVREGAPA